MYLANKGSIVAVPEVNREDSFWELLDFFDNEAFSISRPTNNIKIFVVLDKHDDTYNIS